MRAFILYYYKFASTLRMSRKPAVVRIGAVLAIAAFVAATSYINVYRSTASCARSFKRIGCDDLAGAAKARTLARTHSHAHAHDSLDLRELCQQVFVPPTPTCPRFLTNRITRGAGFGHKFTELLFGLRAAHDNGFSYVFEPFESSVLHGEDYSIVNDLLGLPAMFKELGGLDRQSIENMTEAGQLEVAATLKPNGSSRACGVVARVGGFYYCDSAPASNCFVAPQNEFLFDRARSCFRQAVRTLGTALNACTFPNDLIRPRLPEGNGTVIAVWHIRVGDFFTHKPTDVFYERVLSTLKEVTRGFQLVVLIVGGGTGKGNQAQTVPAEYISRIADTSARLWGNFAAAESGRAPRVIGQAYSFRDAFVAMMQADILIGSGSSLPPIAALVSDVPLFFNHVMKHGFHYGAEFLADSVDLHPNGTTHDSRRRLRIALHGRMRSPRRSPCHSID